MQGDELILNMKRALDLALNACCQGAEAAGHADGVPRRWQRGEKRHVEPQLLLDRDGEKEKVYMLGKPLMRRTVSLAVLWNGAEDDGPVNSR